MRQGFDDSHAIGKRLRRLSSMIDQDAKRLYADQGVKFEQRWFGLLNQLVLNGPMSVQEISEELQVTHASVSEARSSLEKAGLVRSSPDKTDKRKRLLSLTKSGEKLVARMRPLWQAMEEASVDLNKEAANIVATLDRLTEALERQSLFDRVKERLE